MFLSFYSQGYDASCSSLALWFSMLERTESHKELSFPGFPSCKLQNHSGCGSSARKIVREQPASFTGILNSPQLQSWPARIPLVKGCEWTGYKYLLIQMDSRTWSPTPLALHVSLKVPFISFGSAEETAPRRSYVSVQREPHTKGTATNSQRWRSVTVTN